MFVKGKRTRNLDAHLPALARGKSVVFGISGFQRFQGLLEKIGLIEALKIGESVLPPVQCRNQESWSFSRSALSPLFSGISCT